MHRSSAVVFSIPFVAAAIEKRGRPNQTRTRRINPLAAFVFQESVRIECGDLRIRERFISIFMSKAGHARGFRDYPGVNHRFIAAVECTPHPAHAVLCEVKDRSHLRRLLAGSAADLRRSAQRECVSLSQNEKQNCSACARFL
jgi:hypothetical protein